jgi:hypothetical protein
MSHVLLMDVLPAAIGMILGVLIGWLVNRKGGIR